MFETLTSRTNAATAVLGASSEKSTTGPKNDSATHPNAVAEIINIHPIHSSSNATRTHCTPDKSSSDDRSGIVPVQSEMEVISTVNIAPVRLHQVMRRMIEKFLFSVIVGIAALAAGIIWWHYATINQLNFGLNFQNVPAPLVVWDAFKAQLASEDFYTHISVSLQRVGIAFVIAAAVGIVLGLIGGRSRIGRAMIMPYVEIFRPIPAVAWIPLSILMWPTEEASIIYITFLGALFPIILNTMHGVDQTPEVLVRAARSLGAGHGQIFRYVVLPAALPSIATGLAVAMGVAWFSLLAGEIISGQYGIGYFTWNAYSLINYPDIVVGMLCIGFLGTLSTYAVRLATKPFLRWQERTR